MDEKRNVVIDPTKAEYALRKYLELFNSDCDFFKFFIAQNGVLEWFGRTIKSNQKIHDFLRYEVCPQYDHLFFESAQTCEPFECKSAHMETKRIPTDQDVTSNKNSSDSSFADDKIVSDVQTPTTSDPEITVKDRRGSITPPSSAKRFKHNEEYDPNRSFPPLLNIDDYFDRKDTTIKTVPHSIKSCFITPNATTIPTSKVSNSDYSELKYFETIGILRSCTQPEHRSFRIASAANVNGTWDRETRIRISYRIRLNDNDIQFALIVYQNVHQYSSISKRNLMSEFDEVATQKKLSDHRASITKPAPTTSEVKRKIGRRLRLL